MKEKRLKAILIVVLLLGACIGFEVEGKSEPNADKTEKEDGGTLLEQNTQQQYLCAFFYPWYGPNYNHWKEGGHSPPET